MAPSPTLKILKSRWEGGPRDSPCLLFRILKDHRAITSCVRFAWRFPSICLVWPLVWLGLAWLGLGLASVSLGVFHQPVWFGPWFGLVWPLVWLGLVWLGLGLA